MIVDSHVYCFPPADSVAGHASAEEHLRFIQIAYAQHHQPTWRIRDRARASSHILLDPVLGDPWRLRTGVNFRPDHARGRLIWTVDGEDFTKQFYPPALRNLEYTADLCVAEMDYAGIDVALIHTDHMVGRDVKYLAECVRAYPNRLRSMAPVDEWRVATELDAVIGEVTAAITVHGLHAIKFIPEYRYMSPRNHGDTWDTGKYRPFWDAIAALNVPVFFTLGGDQGIVDPREAYLSELKVLMRWMERYPGVTCSLTHGFPYRIFREGNALKFPDQIWEPFGNPNLHLEVSFPVRIGDWWDYPWRETWTALEQMVQYVGANRLMWGTDMPFQNRFCTYRQSREFIERHCMFLSRESQVEILGGTAARVLGI